MTRALIVDDEAPARRLVRDALGELGAGIEIAGECANGPEAVAAVAAAESRGAPVDLLFLDVQMPGLDGFGVLAELEARGLALPCVVFSTAFGEHAVRAFEVAAVDYLLKPFTRARFAEAVGRALAGAEPSARADRLLVERGGVIVPVEAAEVLWVEAAGDYARLHTQRGAFTASVGIGALSERLPADRFARVHRSAIVALPAVRSLRRDGSGGFWAQLAGGAEVRVSRTYADVVRDRLV